MEAVRQRLNRRWVVPALTAVAGIVVGLLYGWVISPVRWVNGTPAQLREDMRVDYMRMAIDSYAVNRDADLALARYQALGDFGAASLAAVGADPAGVDPTAIQRFRAAIEILEPEAGGGEAEPATGTRRSLTSLIVPLCAATLILGVFLAGAVFLRGRVRRREPRPQVDEEEAWDVGAEAPVPFAASAPAAREPLATFRTIYSLGDDLYDDSFSIETPTGDFVGECGVGIGDTIGVGEPKKVTAFEVWLFDKNDIQTVTKVLMSRYAFSDETTRSRLMAKGDPVQAESGGVVYLETASLEVEARIVDMTYGEGALPPGSFFERMTIELRAWPRGAAAQ